MPSWAATARYVHPRRSSRATSASRSSIASPSSRRRAPGSRSGTSSRSVRMRSVTAATTRKAHQHRGSRRGSPDASDPAPPCATRRAPASATCPCAPRSRGTACPARAAAARGSRRRCPPIHCRPSPTIPGEIPRSAGGFLYPGGNFFRLAARGAPRLEDFAPHASGMRFPSGSVLAGPRPAHPRDTHDTIARLVADATPDRGETIDDLRHLRLRQPVDPV